MVEQQPVWETNLCYSSAELRRMQAGLVCSEGVAGDFPYVPVPTSVLSTGVSFYTGSLAVSTGGSGLDLSIADGTAYIQGDDDPDQGIYFVENIDPVTLTAGANASGNPRIDTVVATVRDSDYGGINDDWVLQILPGTATVGATLSNLTGAAALPADSIRLAYVLVPNGFAGPFVNATHIRDVRVPFGTCSSGLPRLTLTIGTGGVTSSPFNFVKATWPWLKSVRVRCIGGGGGGGGGNGGVASGAAKGGGGGGGGYIEAVLDSDTLAATEVATAGLGGSAGSATGGNGSTGGTSTFGAWLTATGGAGGTGMTPATTGNNGSAGGAGGTGSSAGLTYSFPAAGGYGQSGYVHTGFGNRPNGGSAGGSGGGGGRGGDGASSAQDGAFPGGGGGGGGSSTGNAGQVGAVGGDGVVIIELFG